jgi:hypothetical protein
VVAARKRQQQRFKVEKNTYCNAQMAPKMIRKHCAISAEGEKLLENAVTKLGLSARAHDRILKVARTIADLDGAGAKTFERGDSVSDLGPVVLGMSSFRRRSIARDCGADVEILRLSLSDSLRMTNGGVTGSFKMTVVECRLASRRQALQVLAGRVKSGER